MRWHQRLLFLFFIFVSLFLRLNILASYFQASLCEEQTLVKTGVELFIWLKKMEFYRKYHLLENTQPNHRIKLHRIKLFVTSKCWQIRDQGIHKTGWPNRTSFLIAAALPGKLSLLFPLQVRRFHSSSAQACSIDFCRAQPCKSDIFRDFMFGLMKQRLCRGTWPLYHKNSSLDFNCIWIFAKLLFFKSHPLKETKSNPEINCIASN